MSKLIAASDSDDAPVSFVNISEPRLSRTKPDQKHPFDYGQIEYMTSAIVIALVVHIGIETQISSIQRLVSVKTKTDRANKALPGSFEHPGGLCLWNRQYRSPERVSIFLTSCPLPCMQPPISGKDPCSLFCGKDGQRGLSCIIWLTSRNSRLQAEGGGAYDDKNRKGTVPPAGGAADRRDLACQAGVLWKKFSNYAVFRHPENGKWFALLMDPTWEELHLPGEGKTEILEVKCPANLKQELGGIPGILPAYRMNRNNWISVLADGSVPEEIIRRVLEASWQLTEK